VIGASNNVYGDGRLYALYGDVVRPGRPTTADLTVVTDGTGTVTPLFATRVASAGDLDGDGRADIAVTDGEYDGLVAVGGRVWILGGSPTPWGPSSDLADLSLATIDGVDVDSVCGADVAGLGDFSGDGADDLAVTAPGWNLPYAAAGAVAVFQGPIGGALRFDAAEIRLEGEAAGHRLGSSVTATDFDADGFVDLAVAASDYGGGSGRVYLVTGGSLLP
jgi:hypothetical protein